jgi:hypothetical protein
MRGHDRDPGSAPFTITNAQQRHVTYAKLAVPTEQLTGRPGVVMKGLATLPVIPEGQALEEALGRSVGDA